MMKVVYPFENIYNVIGYYLTKNPARHKFVNMLEPENVGRSCDMPFFSNEILYATVCSAITRMEKANEEMHHRTFWAFYRNRDKTRKEIANEIGRSRQSVSRWIEACELDLAHELVNMRLLDPDELEKMREG